MPNSPESLSFFQTIITIRLWLKDKVSKSLSKSIGVIGKIHLLGIHAHKTFQWKLILGLNQGPILQTIL